MAKCLCSSLSISSPLLQSPPALLSRRPSFVRVSQKCGFSSAPRIVAQQQEERRSDSDGQTSSRRQVLGLGALIGLAVAAPQSHAAEGVCEFTVAPSGLAFCDKSVGSGIPASKGMLIKAHYTGKLENGKVFDSSYNRGKPLTFRVGVGEVIRGWDQGIQGAEGVPAMLAGGKRTLRIPSSLAYGERGAGCRGGSCLIPPNSTLIFDVEFVGKA